MNSEEKTWEEELDTWEELIAFWRWCPDVFLDTITPIDEEGNKLGITLGADQRMFIRSLARMPYGYYVFSRGYGKTLVELASLYVTAILTPDITISMSAQSLQASAGLFADKHAELCRYYPIIESEILEAQISKDRVKITFKSGAVITNLENGQGAKGKRRNLVFIEESALMNKAVYEDCVEPLTSEMYKNIRNFEYDPYVMNRQHFVTTSYYRGDAYDMNLQFAEDMINLKGTMVLGASFELPARFGRGRPRNDILAIKEKVAPSFWLTNYMSRWLGGADNCLIDINKMIALRTLEKSELKGDGKSEYYLSVDVARSTKSNNNQTSICVAKVKRDKNNRIVKVQIPYFGNLPNGLTFSAQAVIVKRLFKLFNAKVCTIDANGLGQGLQDALALSTYDALTGEVYNAWDSIFHDERISDEIVTDRVMYCLKAQGLNSQIIVNFMDYVNSAKLELLTTVDQNNFDASGDYLTNSIFSHVNTDLLIEEVNNLELKQVSQGRLTIEQSTRAIDKDRYSSLAYNLYYLKTYEDKALYEEEEFDIGHFFSFVRPKIR